MSQPDIYAGPRRDDWRTPKWLRENVREQYEPQWDLAACESSSLGRLGFWSQEESFLTASPGFWTGVGWMNPPFSQAEAFFARVVWVLACQPTLQLVAIYKANLETATWQEHILPTCSWVFAPKGRVAYEEPVTGGVKKSSPQFASLLVGWNVPPPRGIPGTLLLVRASSD